MYTFILILHLISAIALVAIVLLQAGKGGGLSGAFGSGMGSETLFGARTGDVLTHTTAVVATVFILSSLLLAYLSAKTGSEASKTIQRQQKEERLTEEQMKKLQEILKKTQTEKTTPATGESPLDLKDIELEPQPAPAPDAAPLKK